MRHSFSAAGIAQFGRDVAALGEVVDRHVGAGQSELGLRKLQEALVLLGLRSHDPGITEADAGPSKGDVEGENSASGDLDGEGGLGLQEVATRLFRSNESGREVLDLLGLEVLSEADARSVLERRIDLGG